MRHISKDLMEKLKITSISMNQIPKRINGCRFM
jgi:hypothetical protein